ncbi:MAG TPA: sensor histidine kinase [Solirubrobacteraceae bacterium]|nr:sensor histidine kinase [Solirubrobacteraceae bacterium]
MSNRRYVSWASRLAAWQVEALLAVALGMLLVVVRMFEAHGLQRAAWVGYLLTFLAGLMVAGRRRLPLAVFAATLTIALVVIAVASPTGAISLPVVIAVFALAQVEQRRRAVLLTVIAGLALALTRGLFQYRGWSDARTAVEPALVLAALFLGWSISGRKAYIAEIEARAAQAERTREEEARRRVDAERLRIARELHDVLAHSIATINLQAGVAAHVLHERPEHGAEALRTIKATSKEALRELRGILGVLRDVGESEPREPTPGLSQLDRLIHATCRAGVPTQLTISGRRRSVSGTVDLAAYRIVQESLTNVLRHSRGTNARVEISYDEAGMTISVDDDGRGTTGMPTGMNGDGASPGHGILGMRERAHALGGEVEAGPRLDGGFRVCARLPVASRS